MRAILLARIAEQRAQSGMAWEGLAAPLCTEGSARLAAAATKLDPARSSRLALV